MSQIDITIHGVDAPAKQIPATAQRRTWGRQQAMKKGWYWLLATWGLAAATIFIPIVHFVSVPALLLAGPLVGFLIYKLHLGAVDIVTKDAICPACTQPLALEIAEAAWPLAAKCPRCGAALSITSVPQRK